MQDVSPGGVNEVFASDTAETMHHDTIAGASVGAASALAALAAVRGHQAAVGEAFSKRSMPFGSTFSESHSTAEAALDSTPAAAALRSYRSRKEGLRRGLSQDADAEDLGVNHKPSALFLDPEPWCSFNSILFLRKHAGQML